MPKRKKCHEVQNFCPEDGGSKWLEKFTAYIFKTEGTHHFKSPSILKTEAAGDSRKVTSYTLKMDAASDSSSFLLLWRTMQQVPLLVLVPTYSTTQHHIPDDHSLDTTGRCRWCLQKWNTIKKTYKQNCNRKLKIASWLKTLLLSYVMCTTHTHMHDTEIITNFFQTTERQGDKFRCRGPAVGCHLSSPSRANCTADACQQKAWCDCVAQTDRRNGTPLQEEYKN